LYTKIKNYGKSFLAALLLTYFAFVQFMPEAEALDYELDVNDLVVLVVDSEITEQNEDLVGLAELYDELSPLTLEERVERFAEDIVDNENKTDTEIIYFDKTVDNYESLKLALENIYHQDGHNFTGVILIGDIQLPTLTDEDGNEYESVFPYTDFDLTNEHPEIWHGIIQDELATFFDKNHLYKTGHPEFANFDQQMFFGDLVNLKKNFNRDTFKRYLTFLDSQEDLIYNRYNKYWAQDLLNEDSVEDLGSLSEDGAAFLASSQNGFENQSDIYMKEVIDGYMRRFYEVFPRYISDVNDYSNYTGRYEASDVDSFPKLISIKDEENTVFLKELNDKFENATNTIVEEIAEDVPLLEYSDLSGSFRGGADFSITLGADAENNQQFFGDRVRYRFHYLNETENDLYIQGTSSENLNNVKQCLPFLGSTKTEYFDEETRSFDPLKVDGEYSILTRALRSDNLATANELMTTGVTTQMQENGARVISFLDDPKGDRDDGYKSELEKELEINDLVTKVNGQPLTALNTFDQAIIGSYDQALAVLEKLNAGETDYFENFSGQLVSYLARPAGNFDPNFQQVIAIENEGEQLPAERTNNLDLDRIVALIDYTYLRNGELQRAETSFTVTADGEFYYPSNGRIDGERKFVLDFTEDGFENYGWNGNSAGALFTLYNNNNRGYGGFSYDGSAGCNYRSTMKNSDRCFGMIANIPVKDAGGSTAIAWQEDGVNFKNNVGLQNPENAAKQYLYPENYAIENVDEVIINSCYQGLPSVVTPFGQEDSNRFENPLHPVPLAPLQEEPNQIENDYYNRLLNSFGNFILSNRAKEADYTPGQETDAADFNPSEEIYLETDRLTAQDVILNDLGGRIVTLKDFSDFYGLFDQQDNDNDGFVDEMDESDLEYGLPANDLNQIARKMLNRQRVFTVPFSNPEFEDNRFNQDIVLRVDPEQFENKSLSSVIVHNEPSDETLREMLISQTAKSMPIDNPRYVAFMSNNREISRIDYLNLFEFQALDNQTLRNLIITKAVEIANTPGSERFLDNVNNLDDENARRAVAEKILREHYLPILLEVEEAKVLDAINWQNKNINEKFWYVFSRFLDSQKDSYVADSSYEVSYFYLDQTDSGIEFDFNLQKEVGERELQELLERVEEREENPEAQAAAEDEVDFDFVPLAEFFDELQRFLNGFSTEEYEVDFVNGETIYDPADYEDVDNSILESGVILGKDDVTETEVDNFDDSLEIRNNVIQSLQIDSLYVTLKGSRSLELAKSFLSGGKTQAIRANSLNKEVQSFAEGFRSDDKQMLLFAAGNSIGESWQFSAQSDELIFGDPTVRLDREDGYGQDIGEALLKADVQSIHKLDFNGDGQKDLLVIEKNATGRVLVKDDSRNGFTDIGMVVNIEDLEVLDTTVMDFNGDGFDDILVATEESCVANEECLSLYINNDQKFERQTLNLNLEGLKIRQLEAHDFNNDNCQDLILVDEENNLKVFYNDRNGNSCDGLRINHGFKTSFEQEANVTFSVANGFIQYRGEQPKDGRYLDIRLKVDDETIYFYAYGLTENGEVRFARYEDNAANNQAQPVEVLNEQDVFDLQRERLADKNFDGCPDLFKQGASAVSQITNAISNMSCSGQGCGQIPFNKAFFVPDGLVSGYAPVAFYPAHPSPVGPVPLVRPGRSDDPINSTFRFYLSPTLTQGLGTAVCFGPGVGHASPCYVAAKPGGLDLGLCDELSGALDTIVDSAQSIDIDPEVGLATVVSDGVNSVNTGNTFNRSFDSDAAAANVRANIKIPGFPAVVTNWLDNQIDEIYNKLLDFPTFTLVLPEVGNFLGDNFNAAADVSFQSANDFAQTLSKIPLIDFESKEILVRVPTVDSRELEKYKMQYERWVAFLEQEIRDKYLLWNCDDDNPAKRNFCDAVRLDLEDLSTNVENFMQTLDQIGNLPKEILNFQNLEIRYANQIIAYLDAVMDFLGGYIKRQGRTIESWIKAARDAVRTFRDWEVIINLSADYQASCDRCRNDRFSKLGALLDFFIQIPEPPIIEMPKWPNIVVDLSQIRTGISILWPDVVFRPEPILLPDLPTISLPEIIPPDGYINFSLDIPDFNPPDIPVFTLPVLPDLPPLNLPELPDIPRPPRIPSLPKPVANFAVNLRPVFRILCLLKNGLIPVPEAALATEIETLTQPSVSAVLSLIKGFAIEWDGIEYDYVKEVRVDGKLQFQANSDIVYETAKEGFAEWNEGVQEFVENINQYTDFPYSQYLDQQIQELNQGLTSYKENFEKENWSEDYYFAVDSTKEVAVSENSSSHFDSEVRDAFENFVKTGEKAEIRTALNNLTSQKSQYLANNNFLQTDGGNKKVVASLLGEDLEREIIQRVDPAMRDTFAESLENANISEVPKGLFIINSDGESENVLNYTEEMSEVETFFFGEDLILRVGDLVTIKRLENSNQESGDLINANRQVADIARENQPGIKNLSVETKNEEIVLTFDAVTDVVGYEINLNSKKVYAFVEDLESETVQNMSRQLSIDLSTAERIFNEDKPFIKVDIENGDYDIIVYGLNYQDGEVIKTLASNHLVASPNICGDQTAPTAIFGEKDLEISLFEEFFLDASNSFDLDSGISEYFLQIVSRPNADLEIEKTNLPRIIASDLDVQTDENGDGNPANDRSNPQFRIDGFKYKGDIGSYKLRLHILDGAGNRTTEDINLEVVLPTITLNENIGSTIRGEVSAEVENIPVKIIRERYIKTLINGEFKYVPEIKSIANTFTDVNGNYSVTNLITQGFELSLGNGAEIDGKSGAVDLLNDNYQIRVIPGVQDGERMYLEVVDQNGRQLSKIYLKTEDDKSVDIVDNFVAQSASNGVYIKVLDNERFQVNRAALSDQNRFGGAYLETVDNVDIGFVSRDGNVIKLDENLKLEYGGKFENWPVIKVLHNDLEAFEILLVIDGQTNITNQEGAPQSELGSDLNFQPENNKALSLLRRGFEDFEKNKEVTRGEFVITLLEMLCIIPREEAYLAYREGEGYLDIQFDPQNVTKEYAYIKEATLRGLIEGYRGETDPATGLTPFKKDQKISRAEAVKIILEALEMQGVIDLKNTQPGSPWYAPYLEIAADLTPYLNTNEFIKNNYLLLQDEILDPNEKLNFGQLETLILRVLDVYNCHEIDSDGDGLSNYCEERYQISNPREDFDNDGLSNVLECNLGLDPTLDSEKDSDGDGITDQQENFVYFTNAFDPDTDGGGITDYDELLRGSDPLNAEDDFATDENQNTQEDEGITIVANECNICPCQSTISPKNDIMSGDIFYAIIATNDSVFARSNEVLIEK
jgi:hypothetical protein